MALALRLAARVVQPPLAAVAPAGASWTPFGAPLARAMSASIRYPVQPYRKKLLDRKRASRGQRRGQAPAPSWPRSQRRAAKPALLKPPDGLQARSPSASGA